MAAAPPAADVASSVFVPFLLATRRKELLAVLHSPDPDAHYGVRVSLAELSVFNHGAAEMVLAMPRKLLPLLDDALYRAQEALLADHPSSTALMPKPAVHARLSGLALHHDSLARDACPAPSDVGAAHADRLLTVTGTVTKTGPVKALEVRRVYECCRCKHSFVVEADIEMGGQMRVPRECPTQKRECKSKEFRHDDGMSAFTNWQEVRIQEQEQSSSGSPRALTVLLLDDLVDAGVQVGDEVEVSGVVIRQFGPMIPGMRCQVGLALQATDLSIANERKADVDVTLEAAQMFSQFWQAHAACPLLGRNKIVASICPELHGLFHVKLATLLMLIGGVERQDGSGTHIRGEVHMLLVGDPGTGKSQFQKYVSKLASRAVITNGRATTSAGLTASAVQDSGGWTLEAGALVLADGGVCLIDEFDGIPEKDRASIHEAMEQQTTSVAKAGMMVTLHTRAAVFATCNPGRNQRYNPRLPLSAQLNISGPLLSRFDIIILLLDQLSPEWDEVVATHILDTHHRRGGGSSGAASIGRRQQQQQQRQQEAADDAEGWPLASLRQYIKWAKTAFNPTLSDDAQELLSGYYQLRRQHEARQGSRTTVRMLESLVRVAQAHARLMARPQVTQQDAVVAVWLAELSSTDSQSGSVLGDIPLGSGGTFPDDPDADYAVLQQQVVAAVVQSQRMLLEY
ncbi:hypothetical protein ABPG75_001120 [Micractinium tetrahymenae]